MGFSSFMGRRRVMEYIEITQEIIQELIHSKQIKALKEVFEEYNIVNLAEIVGELTIEEALFIFKVLNKNITGEIFAYLPASKQQRLISVLTGDQIKEILHNTYTDDIVDFLEELPANMVKDILKHASNQQRAVINQLLSYPDNTAGSIMTTNYVELKEEHTVMEAMSEIKKSGGKAEQVDYCFVVDLNGCLIGIVSLRDILFAPEDSVMDDLMHMDVISVKTNDDQEEASSIMRKYDITVLPVLDTSNRLVGMITADDIIDIIQDEATEDIQKMGAITPIETRYLDTRVGVIFKSRITWLLILMVTYALSSMIITSHQELLAVYPALLAFLPMLMDTTGDAGSQALAMVVRGIVVDDLTIKDFFKVVWKEFAVATICGLCLFLVNMARMILFVDSAGFAMALVVSLTMFILTVIAKLVGGVLPLIAILLKQDPASMASPIITTVCDSLSLLIYFSLAIMILGM